MMAELAGLETVALIEPLDYPQFVHAQKWATLILTDSGGVQEEAPSFGKPVEPEVAAMTNTAISSDCFMSIRTSIGSSVRAV